MPKLTKKLSVTDGRTNPNYRKSFAFKNWVTPEKFDEVENTQEVFVRTLNCYFKNVLLLLIKSYMKISKSKLL